MKAFGWVAYTAFVAALAVVSFKLLGEPAAPRVPVYEMSAEESRAIAAARRAAGLPGLDLAAMWEGRRPFVPEPVESKSVGPRPMPAYQSGRIAVRREKERQLEERQALQRGMALRQYEESKRWAPVLEAERRAEAEKRRQESERVNNMARTYGLISDDDWHQRRERIDAIGY